MNASKLFSLKPHPFSTVFPQTSGDDYDHLVQSIKKFGKLRYAIIVYQNQILDGNSRIRACRDARVEPKYQVFEGTDEGAMDLVWDLNIGRRHMTPSQKGAAVAKATLMFESGRPSKKDTGVHLTTKFLSEKAGVSMMTVKNAKTVLKEGTDEEIKALETGTATARPLAEQIKKRNQTGNVNGAAVDSKGKTVPPNALPYWNRKAEANNVLNQISAARGQVKKLSPDDPMWGGVNLNGVIADLNSAFNRFSAAIPAYVCPYCDGVKPDKCKGCKGKGVLSKYFWKLVPEELKK